MSNETEIDRGAAQWSELAESDAYRNLMRIRTRLSWVLTAIMLGVYLGYILLIAFERDFLAQPMGRGVTTIGIPIGVGVILIAIALTGIYVRMSNRRFDALEQAVRREAGE